MIERSKLFTKLSFQQVILYNILCNSLLLCFYLTKTVKLLLANHKGM